MKPLLLALLLTMAPAIAGANCITTRIANLNPDLKDWIITSGDMKPTLEPGDCILADLTAAPEDISPGAIIVFRHPARPIDFVKRIVARGGDSVQMIEGALHINGAAIQRQEHGTYTQLFDREGEVMPRCPSRTAVGETCEINQYLETLADITFPTLDLTDQTLDSTGVYQVPAGHVFVLGDHRDNSTDSRVPISANGIGFVPLENIIGVVIFP